MMYRCSSCSSQLLREVWDLRDGVTARRPRRTRARGWKREVRDKPLRSAQSDSQRPQAPPTTKTQRSRIRCIVLHQRSELCGGRKCYPTDLMDKVENHAGTSTLPASALGSDHESDAKSGLGSALRSDVAHDRVDAHDRCGL